MIQRHEETQASSSCKKDTICHTQEKDFEWTKSNNGATAQESDQEVRNNREPSCVASRNYSERPKMENQEFQIAKPYRKKEFQSVRVAENSLAVTAKNSWFEIPLGKIVLISEGDRRLVDFTARHTDHPVIIRDDKDREYKFYLGLSDRLNFVRILRTRCDNALYIDDRSEYELPKSNTAKNTATRLLSRRLVKRVSLFGMILLSSLSTFVFAVSTDADMLLICFSLSFAIGSAVKVVEAIRSIRKLRNAEE